MPRLVYYKDDDGSVPVQDFLAEVSEQARVKIIARFDRLRQLGHRLRRPEADYVGEGIYELRAGLGHVNYRVLYFFHGNVAAVLAHGLTKEDKLPRADLERALQRKAKFEQAPQTHTFEE